ncbi:MAG: FG-GAP repeat protein [Niastella sp.]|nr:FG-GAP repeat protein [Niastella sp.]
MRMMMTPLLSLLIAFLYQPATPHIAIRYDQSVPPAQTDWYSAALRHIGQPAAVSNRISSYELPFANLFNDSVLPGPGKAEATFGASVTSAGDLNGDGYSDVVIGAPIYDSIEWYSNEGRVYVYYGTPTGLPIVPDLNLEYHSNSDQGERFGISVAGAGDINGDGYGDLVVGAMYASDDGYNAARGQALVYFGSPTGIPSEADTILKEDMGFSQFGESVAGAGDVNGDGYSDIIVGAPGYGYSGGYPQGMKGRTYVFYGSATGFSGNDYIEGEQYANHFGALVTGMGDVNGDGYSDIAVGAPDYDIYVPQNDGAVYVYYGSATGLTLTPAHMYTNTQPIESTYFGRSMAGGGDLNGDGYTDLVIGQPRYHDDMFGPTPFHSIGRLLIYYGSPSGLPADPVIIDSTARIGLALSGPVGSAGDVNGDGYADIVVGGKDTINNVPRLLIMHGSATGLQDTAYYIVDSLHSIAVTALAAAGDIDGDGYTDIVAGDANYDAGDSLDAGRAYIFHGAPDSLTSVLPAVAINHVGLTVIGFGKSLQHVGDINGDGYSDVVIGDPNYIKGTTNYEGRAYVYYGSANGLPEIPNVILDVNQPNCKLGYSVAGSDVNGDGYADVIVSAPRYNNTQGRVFIYYGSASGVVTTPAVIPGAAGQYIGYAVDGAGDLNGDGYGDVLVSAYNDIVTIDTGKVFVYYGSATGLPATPDLILKGTNDPEMAGFGRALAGVGDVNGDGYGDAIIGAFMSTDGSHVREGRAYLFRGSDTGLVATSPVILDNANRVDAFFGTSVAGAGDINADGYADVLVGAADYTGGTDKGQVFVYLGSASGISTTPSDTLTKEQPSGTQFGNVVASAGDINSDGYADALITDAQYQGLGIAYIYKGTPTGLAPVPDTIHAWDQINYSSLGNAASTAGDVNGDGFTDLLLSNLAYQTMGSVYLYYGGGNAGRRNNLRLYNANLTTPLSAANMPQGTIGAGLLIRSSQGLQKARLVWETRTTGNAFSGNPVTNSTAYTDRQATFTSIGLTGTELKSQITKTGKATLLRARVEYSQTTSLTGQRFGPWRYPLTVGRSEGVLLPLDILTFTGVKQQKTVLIRWTVASYEEGAQFTLERSSNGRDYTPLYSTPALPNVTQYQWRDEHPMRGKNYFRLVAVDRDRKKYLKTALVVFDETRDWLVFPNPVRAGQSLTVQLPGITGIVTAKLSTSDGRIIQQKQYTTTNGLIQLSTVRLPAGQYTLSLTTGGSTATRTVLIVQ